MSDMYAGLLEDASSLIQEYGKAVTITRDVGGVYDPITKVHTPGIITSYSAYAVEDEYKRHEIDGTLIRVGDRRFMLAATVVPELGDIFTVNGVALKIVAPIKPLSPSTTVLYYEVQARG